MGGFPRILYLGAMGGGFVETMKLAGIWRYAAARRWEVVPVPRALSVPARVPALLKQHRPLGCIVEFFGGDRPFLKPGLFGPVPTVYLDMPNGLHRRLLGRIVSVDDEAVARAALRELAAVRPVSFAAVEFEAPLAWSRFRARTFRSLAEAEGRRCSLFSARHGEEMATRATRLAEWVSLLPRPCGVFAVNDVAASEVRTACRAARLHIPRDISIVGVDNDAQICEAPEPTLTSIQIDFERSGFLAAKMLGESSATKNTKGHKDFVNSVSFVAKSVAVGPLMAVRRKSTSGRGRHEPRILEAVEMIRREACDGLTAADLIARFPGSRWLFEQRFREAMGHSVLDEILHVRLERVLTLLSQTDMAFGAIADFCGFRTYWGLDDLFRSRFKMSMGEWRRKNRRDWT
ncbi:MAG: substrate-binding domain-containing protein [Kiritimatiellae bacterium]|nr:substrate-binding domain-containing protein [Kiritimatiellia bacterium]MBQ6925346.1 substrate-binding domain-containing protein [Kiritimatiellia bacterium]